MIMLDTNVLSELMREEPSSAVVEWIDRQDRKRLFMTVVSEFELSFGLATMPAGKRKNGLVASLHDLQKSELGARIVPLDAEAAKHAAIARAAAESATGHCDVPDALLAGIAMAKGAAVATRNLKEFMHFGVPLINPWT